MKRFTKRLKVEAASAEAADVLAAGSGLSKTKVKDAMVKGAAWIKKKGRLQRIRKSKAAVKAGDLLELHYDEAVLAVAPPEPGLIADEGGYSVWLKPSGLMAQGTMFGDHCSILRQTELFFGNKRKVYPVHRLDREVAGITLVAHTADAAAGLSQLFRENLVTKKYRAEVLGEIGPAGMQKIIDLPLDGKKAKTTFAVLSYDPAKNVSVVEVAIETGRLHQIRRHFDMLGHPVMGDPKYGHGNKNREGLRLTAYYISFRCPFRKRQVEYKVPETPG
jgi:tRNA pseudouridine32 synthase/23S rRNA pseudouridine746 synthase